MTRRKSRREKLELLKRESDGALQEQIYRLLRLAPGNQTHFLWKRIALFRVRGC